VPPVSKEWFLILLRKDKKKLSVQNLTAKVYIENMFNPAPDPAR
jgi:hypothetical protein